MPNVVSLKAFKQAKTEAVELSESVYGRMQSGELTSVLYIARGASGKDEIGIAGEFADDMKAAERAAVAGFEAMFGHSIEATPARRPLPRDLSVKIDQDFTTFRQLM